MLFTYWGKEILKLNIYVKTNHFIYILHNVLTWSWSFYIEIYSKNYFSLESAIEISTVFVSLFCCHTLILLDFHWGRNFGCTYRTKTLDCNFLKEDFKIDSNIVKLFSVELLSPTEPKCPKKWLMKIILTVFQEQMLKK